MKKKNIILIAVLIIVFINLPFWTFFIEEQYTYSNADGTFKYNEESGKGASFQSCLITYGNFLCQHPDKDQGDNRLYRTFTIKPWYIWEWRQMIFHSERFQLRYLEPVAERK